ncbi:MAG: DUF4139 domain-containing protein [Alphaproteobacteria bacterium]|nr:DUF4139 domain-containing protein [Alphaproteobacteria bacterium]
MKTVLRRTAVTALALTAGIAAACILMAGAQAATGELSLKRVVLSTGGVGYLESEATADGDATLTLDVPLDQVDDVLKSLIVYDPKGSAGEITLPGREPLTQSFADLPFDRAALNSEVDLLNALQGAEIKVTAPRVISGRLVHVDQDTATGPGGIAEPRDWVSVMTDTGLQRFALRSADAIAFTDAALQHQVETALNRIAAYRATGRRQLTLQAHGSGQRTVRVGYVVGMPLWKATYRLSLPTDPNVATAHLQGWAVLENMSGRAWQDVQLTLLSGNPVTFRQALYESYYVPRPSVPVESGGHVLPPADNGTVVMAQSFAAKANEEPAGARRRDLATSAPALAAPPPPPVAAPMPAPIEAASAEEGATQVAFTAPYRVSVAAGQSLVLPLLDRDLPAQRTDLYQSSVDRLHPLAAIGLRNDTGTGLPPGVLTLYQQGDPGALYLGDARLAAFPAGDKRLLSFAIDNKVMIDSSSSTRRPVIKASIADGVLHLGRAVRSTTMYAVKANTPPSKLLIEQPRNPAAKLIAPDPNGVEVTPGAYRLPVTLGDKGQATLSVVEEQPVEETIRLLDIADDRLDVLVSSTELDAKTRQLLGDLAARRQKAAQQRAELNRLKEQRGQLVEDEKRLRANLAVLGNDPVMHKAQLDKFNDTETAIETTTKDITSAANSLATSERDLNAYIAHLTL